jgi:hypothetical protein
MVDLPELVHAMLLPSSIRIDSSEQQLVNAVSSLEHALANSQDAVNDVPRQ